MKLELQWVDGAMVVTNVATIDEPDDVPCLNLPCWVTTGCCTSRWSATP